MPARTLVWTGNAGDNNFATAGNWQNAQTGHAAKKAPHRHDTVELLGSGTITGTGAVAALDVGTNSSFLLQSATITANTVTDTGNLALATTQIYSRAITVGSATEGGILSIENATLSAIGPSLDLSIGGAGYSGMYVEQSTFALGTGTLSVGSAAGGGFLNELEIASISAATLEIGNGGGGEVNLQVGFLTLGSANGVGLSVGAAPGGGSGFLKAQGGSITVKGAVDIGTEGTGSILFEFPTTFTTLNGVTLGSTDGNDGSLFIVGTWNDTGNVIVNNGSALGLGISETVGTIHGNLTMAAENDDVLSVNGAALSVSGTVTVQAYGGYTPIVQFQNGASLTCGAFVLQSTGNAPYAQFETGASLTAGNLSIASGFDLQTTGATLDVLHTLELGAGGTLTTSTAQIGSSPNSAAATIGGTLAIITSNASIDGTLALTGGLLDISSSTLSLTAHGTALAASGGTVDVTGSSNSAATLATNGGIAMLDDSMLTIDYGNVTATAAGAQPALTVDATSSLNLSTGALTLNGNADIAGQMKILGTLTESGSMTIAATGSINAWGTVIIAGAVDNLGHFTSNMDTPDFMGPVTGTGTFATGASGALAFQGSVAAGVTVDLSGGGTVTIGNAADFHATIADWAGGDALDLLNLAATSDSVTGQTLTLYDSNNAVLANLLFAQPIGQNNFVLQQDGHGDTVITYHS